MNMTAAELRQARAELGVTGEQLARALDVDVRTFRGWEGGARQGRPAPVPGSIAILVRLALKFANVRRELGIPNNGAQTGRKGREAATG
jgi:transcriptional regulator with XRE-family HTH domain